MTNKENPTCEKLSRRTFAAAVLSAPWTVRAQQPALSATVKINTERVIGDIDPKLYGNFIEHLGRCIYGGVFEEGSPLSDSKGFRRDVLDAVKKLNVPILRWPGGNFSSNYHWRDGIGPRDQRLRRLEMAWGTVESNRFGTHEFLDYAETIKTEPYICTNLGTGTWDEAQQWVEYCNSAEDTAATRLRKQNGRTDPWKVVYWGLGNEMDGPWQMGHRSAEDYGKFALEAAKLMKWTDPNIKLIAAGSSNYGPGVDWVAWNRTVLDYLKHHADYLSLHMYVGNPEDNYYEFLTSNMVLADRIKASEGIINAALDGISEKRRIYIAWDEWNVWYRARGSKERGSRILEERYNLEDALVVATFLNTFVNHAHIVKIANMAQLVNVIAPIFTNENGLLLQTIYYPLQLFANNSRGKALELLVESPSYKGKRYDEVPYIDSSAAYDGSGTLTVNLVNRHREQSVDTEIIIENKQVSGPLQKYEVNGPDIKSENNFQSNPVKAIESSAAASGGRFRCRLAPHSYTMLKTRLA